MPALRPHVSPAALLRPIALLVLAVLGALALASGPANAAKDDVTWSVRTASNNFGEARTSYRYSLGAGAQVKDALVISNGGDTPLTLAVYASDGYTTQSGQFDLLTGGSKSTNIGSWVHPGSDSVTVKAGGTAKVPFTVDIPDNATPGDYAGGIVTSLVREDATEGINVDRRLGVRMQLRVGGTLKPGLEVEDLKVAYSGTVAPFGRGDANLTYTIHNTGNSLLSARQSASVSGPFGILETAAGDIDDAPQLLPGETWKVSVRLHDVAPALRLTADVALTPVIVDDAGSITTLEKVNVSSHAWALPWTTLLLVLVVLALVVAAARYLRRLRTRLQELEGARVPS